VNDPRPWSEDQLDRLRQQTGVQPLTGPEILDSAAGDFGRLASGECRAVLRPASAAAVAAVVRFANEHHLGLTPRGRGNSQSGQSVSSGTACLDLGGMREIEVAPGRDQVRCGAGVSFRELANRCAEVGTIPAVMPLNLDLTVGGVLSAGGFGSTSHAEGLVVSTVRSLDVVLGSGQTVTTTPALERPVFDAVLGGLGRCGVVTQAELALRPLRRLVRTYFLLYDDLTCFLEDQARLRADRRCQHLEGFCSASVQGMRLAEGGGRRPFARWFFGLHLGFAHDGTPPDEGAALAGLRHRELLHVEDADAREHATRFDGRFAAMKATGAWEQPHPWIEFFVPLKAARELIPAVLEALPMFLGDGHRLSVLHLDRADLPALLMTPEEQGPAEPVLAFAILPVGVAPPLLPKALEALARVHQLLVSHGARRYMSGWLFQPDAAAWRAHFGEHHGRWEAARRSFDPQGVLRSALFPGNT
jgi:cytokinin dehydrogenase